jgi:predicted Ser/Thr protein kinase
MRTIADLFTTYARSVTAHRQAEMSLAEYLKDCRNNAVTYASATAHLLAAIGESRRKTGAWAATS